jgi:hypothetical protein
MSAMNVGIRMDDLIDGVMGKKAVNRSWTNVWCLGAVRIDSNRNAWIARVRRSQERVDEVWIRIRCRRFGFSSSNDVLGVQIESRKGSCGRGSDLSIAGVSKIGSHGALMTRIDCALRAGMAGALRIWSGRVVVVVIVDHVRIDAIFHVDITVFMK